MIRRKVTYLLLLLAGGFFVMLYDFQGLRFLLCCMLFIPLVSWLILISQIFFCRIGWKADQSAVVRGEETEIVVSLENRGFLPVSRILVELKWKFPGERVKRVRRLCLGLNGWSAEELAFQFTARHCGPAVIELRRAFAYDCLGIFRFPFGKKRKESVCILPRIMPVPPQVGEAYSQILRETGEEKEGDLLLRAFRPGDSLHRVYWKLLAKGGDMQVRDYERSGVATVLLNFRQEFKKQTDAWDRYVDRACSLLYFFAENCVLEAVWRRGADFIGCRIPDTDAVQVCILGLLLEEETGGRILTENEIPDPGRVWRLEEDGGLYFGEQCIYEE